VQQKLKLFKELFADYTNIAILHIDNSLGLVDSALEEVREQNQGNIKYIPFVDENSAKLKATAREYEYIVLGNILTYCSNQKAILKLMYKAIENSGNIIILEKISNDNRYELLDLLENIGFQAPNCIELFDDTYIFTAKKMHHWDNGL
jgi:ubiquinone/menaquinone biosynthesis C-methylase UbiE